MNIIHKFVRDKFAKRFPELESLVPMPMEYILSILILVSPIFGIKIPPPPLLPHTHIICPAETYGLVTLLSIIAVSGSCLVLQLIRLSALIYRTVAADFLKRVMNNQPTTTEMLHALFCKLTELYPQLIPVEDFDIEFKRFGTATASVLGKLKKSNLTKVKHSTSCTAGVGLLVFCV